ncbi:hypothetical protein [Parageobacillus thermoglucosidasius]|uniref:hypothetical protein n=1 Tax=Parageobacillus thermoglucosidasius TaxID=1426 RepID=UPI0001D17A7D|nr:hypothetical protein [Parageobacillus thermoglucosidasius]AEH47103.1 hypothetical protein Geoth_1108 [Parageobacillus thermoglucosidasius C56-YS93]
MIQQMERYIFQELIHYLLNFTSNDIVTLGLFALPIIFIHRILRKAHIIFIHTRERNEIEKLFMNKDDFTWHKFIQIIIRGAIFLFLLFMYAAILHTLPLVHHHKIRIIKILATIFIISSLILALYYVYKKFFSLSNNILRHNNNSPAKNAKKPLSQYVLLVQSISCIFFFIFIFEDLLFHGTHELIVRLLPLFVILLFMLITLFFKTASFIFDRKYKYKIVMRLADSEKIKDKFLFSHFTINQRFIVLSEYEDEWMSNHYYVYDLNQNRYLEIIKVPYFADKSRNKNKK